MGVGGHREKLDSSAVRPYRELWSWSDRSELSHVGPTVVGLFCLHPDPSLSARLSRAWLPWEQALRLLGGWRGLPWEGPVGEGMLWERGGGGQFLVLVVRA